MTADKKRVCVFASSCNYLDEIYYDEASELGKLLGQSNMDMVYGGSSLGLMWACAKEVKTNGGKLLGVMPEKLHNMGVSTDVCDEFFVTPCMRSRKAKMDELCDAVVALAGGFGTLEELTELIVQKQLGYNNKAIVLLNTNGFYNKLVLFFEEIIGQNFARENARDLYFVANSVCDVVEYLKNYKSEQKVISKEDIYIRNK